MKKLMLILLVIGLIGCNQTIDLSDAENKYFVFSDYYDVSSPIESYSLTLSSVPGLPLELKALQSEESYTIEIAIDEGMLLSLTDGDVQELGTVVLYDYDDILIYWSPMAEELVKKCDLTITIKDDNKVIAQADYMIEEMNQSYYLLQAMFTNE